MSKVISLVKAYWKRALLIAGLSAAGTAATIAVHQNGIAVGKEVGRCEMVCVILDSTLIALDGKGCQCETREGFLSTIPIDQSFFE